MVGVAVGLFIVAGASTVLVNTVTHNRRMLVETQVNQDLRAAADIVVRDLRRAGYWVNATSGVWGPGAVSVTPNAYSVFGTNDASSVTYAYARDTTDTVESNEKVGFRRVTVGDIGVLQVQDGLDSWQPLTDPKTLDVIAFSVTPTAQTRELAKYCNCTKTLTCTEASVLALSNRPQLTVRQFTLVLTGRSIADSNVQRTINETVRLRNDQLTGTCPA
jgi:prepilin peptidase dependent protein B